MILAPDERSLQVDLVRLDRTVPVAGCVAFCNIDRLVFAGLYGVAPGVLDRRDTI
jgi:hypothetical protein